MMTWHARRKHKVDRSALGRTLLRDVDHTCAICEKTIKHMKKSLTRHLGQHNMTVETYYTTLIAPSQEGSLKNALTDADVKQKCLEWKDQCLKCCTIQGCGYQDYKQVSIVNHMRIKHGLSDGSAIHTLDTHHQCMLCSAKVRHDSKSLLEHAKAVHGKTLLEYFRQNVLPREGPNDTADDEQQADKAASKAQRTLVNVAGIEKLLSKFKSSPKSPKPTDEIEGPELQEETDAITSGKMEDSTDGDQAIPVFLYVGEEEGLQCKFCPDVFIGLRSARDHMDQTHGYPEEKLTDQFILSKFTEPDKVMKCLKCPEVFKFGTNLEGNVKQHYEGKHGLDQTFEYMDVKLEWEETDPSN